MGLTALTPTYRTGLMTMTFTEMRDILVWSRANRVAHLKLGPSPVTELENGALVSDPPALEMTFFPDKELPGLTPPAERNVADWCERNLGLAPEDFK